MTIKIGTLERVFRETDYYDKFQYEVVEKTIGGYTEVLIAESLYEYGTIVDGQDVPDTCDATLRSSTVYANTTVADALSAHNLSGCVWAVPLTEV